MKTEIPQGQQYHIAKAKCRSCGDIMISERGGYFISCKCKGSFIDQERFGADYVRLGGAADFIEQTCPKKCTMERHKGNNKI